MAALTAEKLTLTGLNPVTFTAAMSYTSVTSLTVAVVNY